MKRLIQVGLVAASIFVGIAWAQAICPAGAAMVGQNADGSPSCAPQAGGGNGGGSSASRYIPPKVIYKPDSYGAVALDLVTGSYGYSSKQSSNRSSKQAALKDCGTNGCKIFSTYANQCMAFAGGQKSQGNFAATGFNLDIRVAQQNALAACSKQARNCKILVSECSLPS